MSRANSPARMIACPLGTLQSVHRSGRRDTLWGPGSGEE